MDLVEDCIALQKGEEPLEKTLHELEAVVEKLR